MFAQERLGGTMVLWLDRPDQRNALNSALCQLLLEAIQSAEADPDCQCLLIRGRGAHFCAGRDLKESASANEIDTIAYQNDAYTAIFQALWRFSKPSVAAVAGIAAAGGFTLAMACDFVLAEASARFGAVEMRSGFPAAVNSVLLTRLAAPRHALELLLSKALHSPERLAEMGLINRVLPDSTALEAEAIRFCADLAALAPEAVKLTKQQHRAAAAMPLDDALLMAGQLNALLMAGGKFADAARNLVKE